VLVLTLDTVAPQQTHKRMTNQEVCGEDTCGAMDNNALESAAASSRSDMMKCSGTAPADDEETVDVHLWRSPALGMHLNIHTSVIITPQKTAVAATSEGPGAESSSKVPLGCDHLATTSNTHFRRSGVLVVYEIPSDIYVDYFELTVRWVFAFRVACAVD
jgi:hypothetical protein